MSSASKIIQAAAGNVETAVEPIGIDFDESNDYLSRSSDLVGNSDGKTFTFSAWVYYQSLSGTDFVLSFRNNAVGQHFAIKLANDSLYIDGGNSSATAILAANAPVPSLSTNTWLHILVSIDLANISNRSIYINDISVSPTWSTYTNQNIAFSTNVTDWTVSALNNSGSVKFAGRLAGVYLDYTYRDLSVEANRRDFIDADGLYVTPPTSGIISVPMDDPADPGRNDGTGGDFTLNGVVAQSGRGPNQYNAAASTFDGSNDYMTRSSITGISDGKVVTFSSWFKLDAVQSSGEHTIIHFDRSVDMSFQVKFGNNFKQVDIQGRDSSDNLVLNFSYEINGGSTITLNKWFHLAFSIDLSSTGNRTVLVDGVDVTSSGTFAAYTNANMALSTGVSTYSVGDNPDSSGREWDGELSDIWFDTTYIDLSSDNPFYDTDTGKPKFLGSDGSEPTGSAPLIYLPLRGDDAGNNLGTGGNFTVNSGPYTGARGPSEFWGESAEFNGSNQGLRRQNTLTGASASASGFTMVCSVNPADVSGNVFTILRSLDTGVGTVLDFYVFNNKMYGRTPFYSFSDTANNAVSGLSNTWIDVMFTVTKDGSWQYWINGVDKSEGTGTFTPVSNQDFTVIDDNYIGYNNSSDYGDGKLGFLWVANEYIDFSQEANRLKFFDAFNNPVDLGEDGSTPTGSQPLIYLNEGFHLGTNLGSGGNFTPQNTPTDGGYVKG